MKKRNKKKQEIKTQVFLLPNPKSQIPNSSGRSDNLENCGPVCNKSRICVDELLRSLKSFRHL